VVRASAESLPAPRPASAGPQAQKEAAAPKLVPVSLEAIFRLAEAQNARLSQARAKVEEAGSEKCEADKNWLPDVFVGPSYFRHEGGIQDFNGRFIHSSYGSLFAGMEVCSHFDLRRIVYERVDAERKVWQSKGELSRLTSDVLLDAAETYVDLLAARTGELVAMGIEKDLESLYKQVKEGLAKQNIYQVEAARVKAELESRRQAILKFREQQAGASAKLVYLLGLDPCTTLIPTDQGLIPLELVDTNVPDCDLVARSLSNGPGVQEMEGLLSLLQHSLERMKGHSNLIPIVELKMCEGLFGAGPGGSSTWDNRWDMLLQFRWNLTDLATRCDRQRAAEARVAQTQYAYDDLRGKLTAGVHESREGILSGREQYQSGQEQIKNAREAYRLSDDRLSRAIPGSSPSEVLISLQTVLAAEYNYLSALRNYNKAQLRLLVLLGPGPDHGHSHVPGPVSLPQAESIPAPKNGKPRP
jgi:outer membrane protein TolC